MTLSFFAESNGVLAPEIGPESPYNFVPGLETYEVPDHTVDAAIYFLCRGERVVYVGQTINLTSRIRDHRRLKVFDEVHFIRVEKSKLTETEEKWIRHFAPEYNFLKKPYEQPGLNQKGVK